MNTKIHRENPLLRHILSSMPRCFLVKVETADYRQTTKQISVEISGGKCLFYFHFMYPYLSASPVLSADGDYPFSNIHVTPRISSSISRSARRRVDGSTQVCLLPKVRADSSSPPPPGRKNLGLSSAPSTSPSWSAAGRSPLEGRREGVRGSVAALASAPSVCFGVRVRYLSRSHTRSTG